MSIALADVPGFPPEAADHLRIHVGIETIAALEDAVSRMGGMPSPRGDGIREPFTRLGVSAKFIDQATMNSSASTWTTVTTEWGWEPGGSTQTGTPLSRRLQGSLTI